jgi:hypothetical protein
MFLGPEVLTINKSLFIKTCGHDKKGAKIGCLCGAN